MACVAVEKSDFEYKNIIVINDQMFCNALTH